MAFRTATLLEYEKTDITDDNDVIKLHGRRTKMMNKLQILAINYDADE